VVYAIINQSFIKPSFQKYTHFQQSNSNTQRHARTPQWSLIIRNRPRIPLQILQDARQLEFALLDGHEEASGSKRLGRHGLARFRSGTGVPRETKHILDLLGLVFLSTAEDVGFGAFGVADFVYLGLGKQINIDTALRMK
jgi:hypothetical protein